MISELQRAWIAERFRHFDAERCAAVFHEDAADVEQRGEFPTVLLRNSVRWYPVRERRPIRDGLPIKAKAPKGSRPLLYDTLEPKELVLVEGEGDLIACLSIGQVGVVAVGGTNYLLGKNGKPKGAAKQFEGKNVRVLFDNDDAGQKAAPMVAHALLEAGAAKVAYVFPPKGDVEDWLGVFDTPTLALSALQQLLGEVEWTEDAEELKEPVEVPLQVEKIRRAGDPIPRLAVMVYEPGSRKAQLAVYAPADDDEEHPRAKAGYEVEDAAPDRERSWKTLDSWDFEGRKFVPDVGGDTLKALSNRTLIIPTPPFEGDDSSAELWDDLTGYYRRWLAIGSEYYDVLAAYCLMTWRLDDAAFEIAGFLRFVGPAYSGKGRALDVMRHTAWRTFTTKPSPSNLHRVVDYYGDAVLVIDEFHPGRGHTMAGTEELVDLLNYAFQRSSTLVKMDKDRQGNFYPVLFSVFGPKILASYECDEDKGFARRCIVVPMTEKPTAEMITPQFTPEAIAQAEALRARLLAWRGRKLALGAPDMEGETFRRVVETAGIETSQVFWPLAEMVPKSREGALANILSVAAKRKIATHETSHTTVEAYLLDVFASLWSQRRFFELDEGGYFIPTDEIAEVVDRERIAPSRVGRMLKSLGLLHAQKRFTRPDGSKVRQKGFVIHDPESALIREVFAEYGVEWPGTLKDEAAEELPI